MTFFGILISIHSLTILTTLALIYQLIRSHSFERSQESSYSLKMMSLVLLWVRHLHTFLFSYGLLLNIPLIPDLSEALRAVSLAVSAIGTISFVINLFFSMTLFTSTVPYSKIPWAKFTSNLSYLKEIIKLMLFVSKLV